MPPVIEVCGIRKTYGSTVAIEEASFEVNKGEIFGLIGPNGAGKTAAMECIEGLRKPDRVAIIENGRIIDVDTPKGSSLGIAQSERSCLIRRLQSLRNSLSGSQELTQ